MLRKLRIQYGSNWGRISSTGVLVGRLDAKCMFGRLVEIVDPFSWSSGTVERGPHA